MEKTHFKNWNRTSLFKLPQFKLPQNPLQHERKHQNKVSKIKYQVQNVSLSKFLYIFNKEDQHLQTSDLVLVDPFSVFSLESGSDSAILPFSGLSPFLPCLISMHFLMLHGITILRGTIRRSTNCFFLTPFDLFSLGIICCNKRKNFSIRHIAKCAW